MSGDVLSLFPPGSSLQADGMLAVGGLGARYTYADDPPGVGAYLDALTGAAREHLPQDAEPIIEPGRSMVASAAMTPLPRRDRQARGAHVRRR